MATQAPPLLALSVRQPWAHAIIHLGKDVENRTRRFAYRGTVLIHASAGMTLEEYSTAIDFIDTARRHTGASGRVPSIGMIDKGGIIGAVDIVDSVKEHDSPWWMGPCGLVMTNPRAFPFIPCRGTVAPLFWTPPEDVLARVRSSLRA